MNRVVVGCTGKLPCHAEFIRVAASTLEALALDQFFQEGLLTARKRGGATYEQQYLSADPILLMWRGSGNRVLAAASIPSRDAAGRLFPFTIFLVLESSSPFDLLIGALESFWNEAVSLLRRQWTSANEVENAVKQLSEQLVLPDLAVAHTEAQRLLWPAADLANTLDNLLAVKKSLVDSKQDMLDYGLGLPLYSAGNPSMQASFSVGLCLKALPQQLITSAVFIRTQPPGAVVIFHGAPLAASFGGLLGNADITEPVFWLHKQSSGNTDTETTRVRAMAEQLINSDHSMTGDALALL